jgi:hypothetical protein
MGVGAEGAPSPESKSFLLLFFKKEALSLFLEQNLCPT